MGEEQQAMKFSMVWLCRKIHIRSEEAPRRAKAAIGCTRKGKPGYRNS